MNVIIMPYRYRNKKVFLVARISSHCHTLYTSYNISELSRQTDELDPLKTCLGFAEIRLGEA
jgi:hypothetical protein